MVCVRILSRTRGTPVDRCTCEAGFKNKKHVTTHTGGHSFMRMCVTQPPGTRERGIPTDNIRVRPCCIVYAKSVCVTARCMVCDRILSTTRGTPVDRRTCEAGFKNKKRVATHTGGHSSLMRVCVTQPPGTRERGIPTDNIRVRPCCIGYAKSVCVTARCMVCDRILSRTSGTPVDRRTCEAGFKNTNVTQPPGTRKRERYSYG